MNISWLQYVLLIHGTQVGIGILTLPRQVAELADTDGWIAIVGGWVIAVFASIGMVKLMQKYPNQSFVDIVTACFGKWLGKGIISLYGLYLLASAYIVLIHIIVILKIWLLPLTPRVVIMALFLFPTWMVITSGIRTMARYVEAGLFLLMWLPFSLIVPLQDAEWVHMLPLLKEGWLTILSAIPTTVVSFLGFELTFFLYPLLNQKQGAIKGIVLANSLTMILYIGVTVFCMVFFSPEAITSFTYPTLSYLKNIEFRFIERLDVVFLSFYIIVISMTWIPYLHWGTACLNAIGKWRRERVLLGGVFGLFLLLVWIFVPSFHELPDIVQNWSYAGMVIVYLFPLLLWMMHGFHALRKGAAK